MTLISCPLSVELKSLVQFLKADGYALREERVGTVTVYICEDLGWILSLGGHGKTQFAVQTQFVLHHFKNITAVVCIGACGALHEDLKIGDVVVATQTIEHDYKERFLPQPLPAFLASERLISKIKTSPRQFHLGIVASGDEDVVDRRRAKEIVAATQAIAVAWEGAGGARVCRFLKIPYIEIRGVTDTADHSAVSDFKNNLKTAMAAVYSLLIETLRN